MRAIPTSHTERIYVKVTSDFDSTGYMQPKSITWADGRTFPIDAVRDFRPAGAANNDLSKGRKSTYSSNTSTGAFPGE